MWSYYKKHDFTLHSVFKYLVQQVGNWETGGKMFSKKIALNSLCY